jgi:RNA polymerase sigma-70 factor (ECF subfamily)
MHTTSHSLLQRLKQPNLDDAWNRFVDLYTPLLFFWSLRTGLSDSESEDLVQDVFVVLLSKVKDFERRRDGSFRKWLQVVTVNKCRERFRRKQLSIVNGNSDFEPLSAVADPLTLTEFWESEYRSELVCRTMQIMQAEFSPKVWQACWEHVVQDRPAADVATELGITANAVRVYSSRVLARLRTELQDLFDD